MWHPRAITIACGIWGSLRHFWLTTVREGIIPYLPVDFLFGNLWLLRWLHPRRKFQLCLHVQRWGSLYKSSNFKIHKYMKTCDLVFLGLGYCTKYIFLSLSMNLAILQFNLFLYLNKITLYIVELVTCQLDASYSHFRRRIPIEKNVPH